MTIEAEAADGSIHEFPDGTDQAVIDRAMKSYANSSMSLGDKVANFNVFDALGLNKPSTQPNTPAQQDIENSLNTQRLDTSGTTMASEMVKGFLSAAALSRRPLR
jgi:hypothetical protein